MKASLVLVLALLTASCAHPYVSNLATEHLETWTVYGVNGPLAGVHGRLIHSLPQDLWATYFAVSDDQGHLAFAVEVFSRNQPAVLDLTTSGYQFTPIAVKTCGAKCAHGDVHMELINLKAATHVLF